MLILGIFWNPSGTSVYEKAEQQQCACPGFAHEN
jgi:hypothetical protein